MIEQRLKELLSELYLVRNDLNMTITDEGIFQEACSFLRGELANANRGKWQTKPLSPVQQSATSPSLSLIDGKSTFVQKIVNASYKEQATEKQKNFIYKNHIDADTENLTKLEANKLIEAWIRKNGGKKK